MSSKKCCDHECSHVPATSSVVQTLDELSFERGIWYSSLNGDVEKLRKQLDSGIDPSICDPTGYTALHYAARNGKEAACSLLIQRRANVNAQTHGGATPLLRAASQGHGNIVSMLLKSKADPSICDSDGKTPLHKAAEGSHLTVSKMLLDHNPQLKNIKDNKGHVPAFYVDPKCNELLNLLSV